MIRFLQSTAQLLCPLMLVVVLANLAHAQPRRRSWRFYSDTFSVGVALLQVDKVQAELNLTDDQIKKAVEIGDKLSADRREIYEGLSREERRERGDELRKKTAELARTAAMTMAESLDDAQKQRWLQITLQVRGPAALPGKYLAERLNLDDEQIKKLNELTAAEREKRSEVFRQSREEGLSREEIMEKSRTLVKETNKERMAILSKEQIETFKEMQGEKFELPED